MAVIQPGGAGPVGGSSEKQEAIYRLQNRVDGCKCLKKVVVEYQVGKANTANVEKLINELLKKSDEELQQLENKFAKNMEFSPSYLIADEALEIIKPTVSVGSTIIPGGEKTSMGLRDSLRDLGSKMSSIFSRFTTAKSQDTAVTSSSMPKPATCKEDLNVNFPQLQEKVKELNILNKVVQDVQSDSLSSPNALKLMEKLNTMNNEQLREFNETLYKENLSISSSHIIAAKAMTHFR